MYGVVAAPISTEQPKPKACYHPKLRTEAELEEVMREQFEDLMTHHVMGEGARRYEQVRALLMVVFT